MRYQDFDLNIQSDGILIAAINEQACADEARQRFYDNLRKLEQEAKKGSDNGTARHSK